MLIIQIANKITAINNLQKLNVENNLIINYIFPKLNKKINNIKKYVEKPQNNAKINYNKRNNK